jgi:hypothetical protein
MNPKYYVTPEQLAKVVAFLNSNYVGGSVKETQEDTFMGPIKIPEIPGKAVVSIYLECGEVINAGLVLDLLSKGYPEQQVAATLRASVTATPVRSK